MATKRTPQQPVFDRIPPQDLDAERSVLGAMLLNPDAIGGAVEILHDQGENVFYAEAHQVIYDAIISLFRKDMGVDVVTLVSQLRSTGGLETSGGASYLSELTSAVPTSANLEYYAKIVMNAAILRSLISNCTQVIGEAYSSPEDVNELLDAAESKIFQIAEQRQVNPIVKVSDLLEPAIQRIDEIIKSRSGYTGLPTGFHTLDQMLSGMQKSDMIVLAARPSVGKTAFALNVAGNVSIHEKKSVLLFSLEMAKEQLVQRLICMEGRINSNRLRSGFLAQSEYPKLQNAASKLADANFFIDDTPNISVLELRSKARRHAAQHGGLDLIIIDYLQLMSGGGRVESRQNEIAEISRSIKGIARELRAPVIALSQLSREAEKDDTGSPKLSHLRESGAIEQDADVVMMLSRPPAHKLDEGDDGLPFDNTIHLNVAKQRNGPTGKLDLIFDKNMQRFGDVAPGAKDDEYHGGGAPHDDTDQAAHEAWGDEESPF
jgi:replicative DNA helicase